MCLGAAILLRHLGADDHTRTDDLLITNQLLYQLSYIGEAGAEYRRDEPLFKHKASPPEPARGNHSNKRTAACRAALRQL